MKHSLTLAATCALAVVPFSAHWEARQPLPFGIAGGVGATLDGNVLYAGGTTWREGQKVWLASVFRYDVARDQWSESTPLLEALAYGPSVSSDDAFEIFGGMTGNGPSLKCWRLSKGESVWHHTGDLPAASALGRAATLKGRTYLFGGCPDVADLSGCTDAVMARTGTGVWQRVGKLPAGPVALAASAVSGEHLYLFGGCAATGPGAIRNLEESWRFSPSDASWHKLRPLPLALRGASAIWLDRHRILLAGGYHASQDEAKGHGPEFGFSKAVWVYHTDRDEYQSVSDLPEAAAGLELIKAGQRVFAIGGEDRARSRSRSVRELRIP